MAGCSSLTSSKLTVKHIPGVPVVYMSRDRTDTVATYWIDKIGASLGCSRILEGVGHDQGK